MEVGFTKIPKTKNRGDAYFYHALDLLDGTSVEGDWDLRGRFSDYTGNVDVAGKRVLDVGTASGFLAFEAEKAGAEVIALDMPVDGNWDIVPYAKDEVVDVDQQLMEKLADSNRFKRLGAIQTMRDGFFWAHNTNKSKVRFYESIIYEMAADIGLVDVAFIGSILLHLRDPFLAVQKVASITRERIVIADLASKQFVLSSSESPMVEFLPSANFEHINATWRLSPLALRRMLETVGFEVEIEHTMGYPFKGNELQVVTLVAKRVRV